MHIWTSDEVQAAHARITSALIRDDVSPELAVLAANAATAVLPTEPVADDAIVAEMRAETSAGA
jgi:hypothetical protein